MLGYPKAKAPKDGSGSRCIVAMCPASQAIILFHLFSNVFVVRHATFV